MPCVCDTLSACRKGCKHASRSYPARLRSLALGCSATHLVPVPLGDLAQNYSLSRSIGARVSFPCGMSDSPAISTLDVRSGHAVCIIAPDVRCPPQWCALNMYCGGRWGAPCLRAAATSSLPACAPSPLAARNLPRSSFAPAARARTCALTLRPLRLARDVRSFLFGRPAARSPLSSLLACGAPPALFPPIGVRAPLRSRSPRRALLLSRCAVRLFCPVCLSRVVTLKARAKPCGMCW